VIITLFNPIILVSRIGVFLYTGSLKIPPKDQLSSTIWWKLAIQRQRRLTQNQQYKVGLFGDSITAPLGNGLGQEVFNFAITAMSTRSLVEQLKVLVDAQVKCATSIVAIGTNDAWYDINDETFVQLMKEAVYLLRLMGSTKIVIFPAFYSSVAAAKNPFLAGTLVRVEEINGLLRQVAVTENVYLADKEIQVLFENKAMRANFTRDGVHLNSFGLKVYRQVLLELISTT
jgi:lysophospholipase L1-like esterase